MKKILLFFLVVTWVILGFYTGNAAAAIYPFNMGPGSSIDTSGTNDVLRMDVVNINPQLDDIIFSLEVGQSHSFYFATIGTTESWINRDDIDPGVVTASLVFDNPVLVQVIGGESVGFSCLWHFFQGWNLTWEDPVNIVLNSGLDFSVELSDVGYKSWFWQGPDGTANICATVTLNAVPLPTTLFLFGSGLLGLIAIRRRRTK